MTGPDSIFRFSENKCEKVCHVSQDTNKVAKQSKLHFIRTQENIYQAPCQCWGKHGWSRYIDGVEGGCQLFNQLLRGLQTIRGNRMFVSLLSSLSISQMTQFTNVGSGINKIIEPSVNTEIENWELELGEIKSKKWVRSRWFYYSAEHWRGHTLSI